MILCLDIGNSHIYGGVFQEENLLLRFRYPSTTSCTSDQLGIFLKSVLRENEVDIQKISHVCVSSVVPSLDYSIQSAIAKYLHLESFFLKSGTKTGLKINYKNPHEIGADRIANAVAAIHQFPRHHCIVVDLGTATTLDIISAEKTYLGGLIMPGLKIAVKALHENTAKLPPVNIIRPKHILGQSTVENIQSGLYYSHLSAIRFMVEKIKQDVFSHKDFQDKKHPTMVIGTGGFAALFEPDKLFNVVSQDLILHGLRLVLERNLSG